MHIEIITRLDALEKMVEEWWALFLAARSPSPFQSPAWLLAWYRNLGIGELRVLAVRDGTILTGLAPFTMRSEQGKRVLRPLGAGVTDICDVLIARRKEAETAQAIIRGLLHELEFDLCDWTGLPAQSAIIRAAEIVGYSSVGEEVAPVLPLRAGATQLGEVVPSGMAANISAGSARAEKLGGLSFEIPEQGQCDSFLDTLFTLHRARWERSGQKGVLAHPAVQSFHRQALPSLIARDLARIHLVQIGDRVAAAHYGLAACGRHYYYLGGYDPDLRAAGPGNLAVAYAIGRALGEGATEFDFLRGDEPYKRRWGALPKQLYRLSFTKAATIAQAAPLLGVTG